MGRRFTTTTSYPRLSPLQAVPAQSGSAGPANSQRRRNLRAIGYQRRRTRVSQLIACTYICQGISSAAQLSALIDEAERIEYHVIGLSETKRKEPLSCTWTDGTSVFLEARKANSTSGVGFLVSPNFSKHVKSVTFHGHRLAILTAHLSRDSQVTIIQAYAPTADSDEEQHDNFYVQLEELVRRQRGYVVVMVDFNARVGSRKHGEVFIGLPSADERNEPGAGERLASFWGTASSLPWQ
uniref:Endo/exonuclease/phosphatase domain-containing protein n=1 Tax=Haemonchus contortus TaxID=6289 RepID=A0A7I4Y1L8_HAECO